MYTCSYQYILSTVVWFCCLTFSTAKFQLSFILSGLSRGTYKVIGNIISVSVVHGGVGPHVLSKRLLCRLTGETTPPVDLMEVEDEDLRNQFQKASFKLLEAIFKILITIYHFIFIPLCVFQEKDILQKGT